MYGKKQKTRAMEYSLTRDLALCSAMPDSAAPGTAHWAPLSLRSPRQEYWSRVPFPTAGDLLHPEIEPASLVSPASAGRYFTTQFSSVVQSCPTLCDPMNCIPWNSPGQNPFLNPGPPWFSLPGPFSASISVSDASSVPPICSVSWLPGRLP